MEGEREQRYLQMLVEPIRVCAEYRPKLGHGREVGMSLADFQALYRSDPFYAWFGLDHPLMYAAHKAAGGMTSVYRQIGIGCERLFRQILQDQLGLTQEECEWSYTAKAARRRVRTLSLDGRIPLEAVRDEARRSVIANWIAAVAHDLKVNPSIIRALRGIVFEVRQGYKSKDSKRQNADIANAANAYSQAYLPCALILSTQIDEDISSRYRAERWAILTGKLAGAGSSESTYAFLREIIGYDLAGFLQQHAMTLQQEVARVLEVLLRAG
ncbi:MAG: hypothetical protein FJ291_27930 [Planctomycetes bacterium]|nr:hypothetical protein [Planctomycetota bacterium]